MFLGRLLEARVVARTEAVARDLLAERAWDRPLDG
jgi:hypothetical protein